MMRARDLAHPAVREVEIKMLPDHFHITQMGKRDADIRAAAFDGQSFGGLPLRLQHSVEDRFQRVGGDGL